MRSPLAIGVLIAAALMPQPPVRAQIADDPYSIIRPESGTKQLRPSEPWLAPKYKSPRGTPQHVTPPRTSPPLMQAAPQTPPPVYVPETGRLLPNLPALPGAGPGGAETGQDRALRCAHQAGVYGSAIGNRDAYIGSCINQ